jgi:hypothetical protein
MPEMSVSGRTIVAITVRVLIVSFRFAVREELYASLRLMIL